MNDNKPFICKDERGLTALRFWLRDVGNFNVVNDLNSDHSGKPVITLGYDSRPDSDWGKWKPAARIICSTDEIREKAAKLAQKELKRRDKDIAEFNAQAEA